MSKAFGLIAILVALYVGMTIYTEGIDHVLGSVFAPIQSQNEREDPVATHLTPGAQLAEPPRPTRPRVRVTDAVRDRVSQDLQDGADRRGY